MALLRFLRLITSTVWVGGIAFFAFVLAPVAFHTLPTVREAGQIVGSCLRVFDLVALACGLILLITTAVAFARSTSNRRSLGLQGGVVALMTLATLFLHFGILPPMDADRAASGGDISSLPPTDPHRLHFDRLHARSEQVEGSVFLGGIALLILMAAASADRTATEA